MFMKKFIFTLTLFSFCFVAFGQDKILEDDSTLYDPQPIMLEDQTYLKYGLKQYSKYPLKDVVLPEMPVGAPAKPMLPPRTSATIKN